jgi:hypothetical protein
MPLSSSPEEFVIMKRLQLSVIDHLETILGF